MDTTTMIETIAKQRKVTREQAKAIVEAYLARVERLATYAIAHGHN